MAFYMIYMYVHVYAVIVLWCVGVRVNDLSKAISKARVNAYLTPPVTTCFSSFAESEKAGNEAVMWLGMGLKCGWE